MFEQLLNAAAAASDASDASFQGVYDAPDEQKEDQNAESEEEANITDALAVNDEPWQHKEPKAQPLKYHVATDGQGGTKLMTITKKINFNSRKEVKAANKIRDQNIRRSQQTPKKRESKAGRHFTPVHEAWAIQEHHNWANTVGGRMPMHNFAPAFNARFPTEHRTVSALTGFIRRSVALKAVRDLVGLRVSLGLGSTV